MKNNNTIAILGGMGPQASTKLLEVILSVCTSELGIKNDSDFPQIVLNSIPVPNFISKRNNSKKAFAILRSNLKMMEIFNPSCFGIACNTAHLMGADLQKCTNTPFVSIIEEIIREVKKSHIKKVGLLATPTTINSLLYQTALERDGFEVVIPTKYQQKKLESIIRKIIEGKPKTGDQIKLLNIAQAQVKKGAQGIILGCTELPLIFPKEKFNRPVFDSIEVLARALLHHASSQSRRGLS